MGTRLVEASGYTERVKQADLVKERSVRQMGAGGGADAAGESEDNLSALFKFEPTT